MRIVTIHLTRMETGFMCVAGLEEGTTRHVRPTLHGARLRTELLRRSGGPFRIGALVELGQVEPNGEPPEVEDHDFDPRNAKFIRLAELSELWEVLNAAAQPSLHAIFGDDLNQIGRGYAVEIGRGIASLGCLRPTDRPILTINRYGQLRMEIRDTDVGLDLAVTDLRFYDVGGGGLREEMVENVAERISQGRGVIVSVGLTRPYARSAVPGDRRRHWLQVNNVHLQDDPEWQGTLAD